MNLTPYYAVIFTSVKSEHTEGYDEMAKIMFELASKQKGFLGFETASDEIGITVSYWETLEDIGNWRHNSQHQQAQNLGKDKWYHNYQVRICKVERCYSFHTNKL